MGLIIEKKALDFNIFVLWKGFCIFLYYAIDAISMQWSKRNPMV